MGISYGYDALGRRVGKTVGEDVYTYVWVGKQMVEEHGPDGVRKFVYGDGVDEPVCMVEPGGTPKSPFMFAGRWYEADAGMYYYRARHYHPELRTFLQPDPLGYEDGMNWYAYVPNNPVNRKRGWL